MPGSRLRISLSSAMYRICRLLFMPRRTRGRSYSSDSQNLLSFTVIYFQMFWCIFPIRRTILITAGSSSTASSRLSSPLEETLSLLHCQERISVKTERSIWTCKNDFRCCVRSNSFSRWTAISLTVVCILMQRVFLMFLLKSLYYSSLLKLELQRACGKNVKPMQPQLHQM